MWLAPRRSWVRLAPFISRSPALKTFVVHLGSLNWVFCKVYTDAGSPGSAKAPSPARKLPSPQAIMEHERYLLGKDPTDIELHWQAMFRYPRWRGGPILNSAISAVEIALWDITGQALGVPVYKLLGGAARTRVRCIRTSAARRKIFSRRKKKAIPRPNPDSSPSSKTW